MRDLTKGNLTSFYAKLRTNGRKDGKGGLDAKTVLQIHHIISSALNYAVTLEMLDANVASAIKMSGVKSDVWSVLNEIQLANLQDNLSNALDLESSLPSLISSYTGVRISEDLGLPWRDLFFGNSRSPATLTVNQTLKRVKVGDKQYAVRFGPPKSNSSIRTIPIPEELVKILKEIKKMQAKNRLLFGASYRSDLDLVCCKADGSPLDRSEVSKKFHDFAGKLGYTIRFHDLSHTFATLLARSGASSQDLKNLLGHSSVGTTDAMYIHKLADMINRLAVTVKKLRSSIGKAVEESKQEALLADY